ncbi:MAG: PAS domain S-box protein, partial [Pyrinomonadaceae bacterium]
MTDLPSLKVLLVEDDEDDYVIVRDLLSQSEGSRFTLTWVATYQEALEAIGRNAHDVCLIDYRLGEYNGVELLHASRALGRRMPAIMLTGQADYHVDQKAMKAGASDYLIKDELNTSLLERSIRYAIERNATLEALRESENRYRRIVETTNEGIWMLDAEGRTSYVNPRMTEVLGYIADELLGRYCGDFMDDRAQAAENLERQRRGMAEQYQLQLRHRDGRWLWVNVSATPMFNEDGEFTGSLAMLTDITERKRAEEALRQADMRAIEEYERLVGRIAFLAQTLGTARDLTTIYRATSDFAVASTGCAGVIVSLYDAQDELCTTAYARWGGQEVEVSGLPPIPVSDNPHGRAVVTGVLVITDDLQAAPRLRAVTGGTISTAPPPPRSSLIVPMSIMGRTVGAVEVLSTEPLSSQQVHATAMQMAANLAASAIENVRLIEQERLRAEQLRQSQKMEAVGQLAGGVAHDFNNLLTAITGYSDLTLRKLEHGGPLRANIEEIKRASGRAEILTRQLLAFSRQQVLKPKVFNLNVVISDMEKMLKRLIQEDIDIRLQLAPEVGQIKADPGQIEQVIVNLAVNARDAMPCGGRLSIETSNVELDNGHDDEHVAAIGSGSYVMLTVRDTGVGMDENTKGRIFEPFFTTKEAGKGTGLGLSTVF